MTEAASTPPALSAREARIALAGQPVLERISFEAPGDLIGLSGDWTPFFRLLAGDAELASGELNILGSSAREAVQRGDVGLVRLDPALPKPWSSAEFLLASAELAGFPPRDAERAARDVLGRLDLTALATRKLVHLPVAERRAVMVAHALLTAPRALCLELPFVGLDHTGQQLLGAVIERAAAGRVLIVAVADPDRIAAERNFVSHCDRLLRLHAGAAVALTPSEHSRTAKEPRRAFVTAAHNHAAFVSELERRGVRVTTAGESGLLTTLLVAGGGPALRYLLELGEAGLDDVLDAAVATGAALIELSPAD